MRRKERTNFYEIVEMLYMVQEINIQCCMTIVYLNQSRVLYQNKSNVGKSIV
jgi:hypothetical protein